MWTTKRIAALLLTLVALEAAGHEDTDSVTANPIRRVVKMLQLMQTRIAAEEAAETKLYDKFQCYCKNSGGDLASTIAASDGKIPQVESAITEAENLKVRLEEELKQHNVDRDAAKSTMAEASAIREKDAAAFAKEKAEYDSNIDALQKATAAITSGMAGGFLQTHTAQILHQFVLAKQDMQDIDRQELLSFLAGSQTGGYVPKGGEVVGILKQLHDDMKAELADIAAKEKAAVKTFSELVAAKKKQVAALTASIEEKMSRVGKLGVDIVTMKQDLSDTQQALMEDRKFLAELDKSCASKQSQWEERKKTRAQELAAIAETIKVLNDDDALDLFKKTLSASASASFVQVKSKATLAERALRIIHGVGRVDKRGVHPELDFLALAIQGKKIGFEKVIKMIDNMIATLKTEQQDDNSKKEYCATQFDSTDDQKKGLERSVSDLENAIAEAKEGLETVNGEIKALEDGVKTLDKEVAEATEQRKEEHADFTELMASNTAAKKLLNFAKNRLNQFYNPSLYLAPEKRELTEAERITVNLGGEVPTVAPGGIAGTGIAVLAQKDAPPPPPETFGAYVKKGAENTGVIAMIDLLIKDLDKDMTEAETEEKNAQADYEKLMNDAASRRATDLKSLTLKRSTKAGLESDVAEHTDTKASTSKELMATLKFIQSLHAECDWLMQYYDVRKEARATEADQLKQAKAVLSGADFSLMQGTGHF